MYQSIMEKHKGNPYEALEIYKSWADSQDNKEEELEQEKFNKAMNNAFDAIRTKDGGLILKPKKRKL